MSFVKFTFAYVYIEQRPKNVNLLVNEVAANFFKGIFIVRFLIFSHILYKWASIALSYSL